jgi:tripartite-type tricarboxylate transporter receptor subunit TctC
MMKTKIFGKMVSLVMLAGLGLFFAQAALAAKDFPSKPITILVSSTAGSPADLLARQVARFAAETLGQPMIVVNRTGGAGGIMFNALMAAPADGYTIASVTASHIAALQSELKKAFSFTDFDFLYNVQIDPFALAVRADSPFKTLDDLIEFARKNPDKGRLQIGGQGTGSSLHLMCLQLARDAGFRFTWLPYKGGADSVANLLGGHVQVISTAPATVDQYVEAGRIRILAITGGKRLPHLKDVPTFRELGYNIELLQFRGFMARTGLPPSVKAKIVEAIQKATQEPGFKAFMAGLNQIDGSMGPKEFSAFARANFDEVGKLLKMLE